MLYFTRSVYKRTQSATEHPLSTSDDNQTLLFFFRERTDVAFFSSRRVWSWDFKQNFFVLLVKQCALSCGKFRQNMFSLRNQQNGIVLQDAKEREILNYSYGLGVAVDTVTVNFPVLIPKSARWHVILKNLQRLLSTSQEIFRAIS